MPCKHYGLLLLDISCISFRSRGMSKAVNTPKTCTKVAGKLPISSMRLTQAHQACLGRQDCMLQYRSKQQRPWWQSLRMCCTCLPSNWLALRWPCYVRDSVACSIHAVSLPCKIVLWTPLHLAHDSARETLGAHRFGLSTILIIRGRRALSCLHDSCCKGRISSTTSTF